MEDAVGHIHAIIFNKMKGFAIMQIAHMESQDIAQESLTAEME
jgi:hypothetical protein